MRIGLVTDTYLPDINGVVSSTVILKEALEKAGHTVFILTNHAGSHIDWDGEILRLPGVRLKGLYGYKMSSPINVGAADYVREMELDVIHIQTNFGVGLYGQYLAKALNIPAVNTYHTMYEDYTHYINPLGFSGIEKKSREAIRAASRKVCNSVQAVIAPSVKTKEYLLEAGVIAPIYVVPTGLNLDAFVHARDHKDELREIRARVTSDPEARIFVFVGRIAKEKSLEMPIEAMALVSDPHFHLAVVGAGPDEGYYKELVHDCHVEEKVHFLGKADPKEVALFYAAFDAFVSASLSETQGMTYLEAMATGTMVFGRRDDVLDGLLEEGVTGYFFDTPEELVNKIEKFYQLDPRKKEECEKACRQRIEPMSAKTFAFKAETVYRQAIEDFSRTFEVDKIRLQDDYVFLTLSRDCTKEPLRIMIPLEDYFDLRISVGTKLDAYLVDAYLDLQEFYHCMSMSRQRALSRDMTHKQVVDYCVYKLDADPVTAEQTACELEGKGLVSDRRYALDKADYWHSIGQSRRQIRAKLTKAGISPELQQEAMDKLKPEVEFANASALAKRLLKGLKSQSGRMKKQLIINKLLNRGYSMEAARSACEDLDLEDDSTALQTAFAKALRLYGNREMPERKIKIRTYCLRRGFERSDIDEMLESEMSND